MCFNGVKEITIFGTKYRKDVISKAKEIEHINEIYSQLF